MYIESIELKNFRNYREESLTFDKGTNLFWGLNAQGKTNMLEALYLAGTTKSHKGAKDRDMVKVGEEESHLRMILNKSDNPIRIDMHLKKKMAKGIAINGQPIKRAADLFGLVSMVFFSPEDLNIIKNGPAERRRFIDVELSQIDRLYLMTLSRYQKCLMQRGKLLQELDHNPARMPELDVWDEQLISYGEAVIEKRAEFIRDLNEIAAEIHHRLTGGVEKLALRYEPSAEKAAFREKLGSMRPRDLKYKTTHAGPHRDDLCVLVNDMDARLFGSQGQQRTAALSLKLSEIALMKRHIHDTPILLLDDVLSELDETRQNFLLEGIRDTQTFITCTGIDEIARSHFKIDRSFHVSAGGIS
ncbi:MAG: DNA replication/repair protein RecF [Lachnospiraceae bacterium]|nr:DNA replication/repair protein RecF [Lachnospiraceae bacterium]